MSVLKPLLLLVMISSLSLFAAAQTPTNTPPAQQSDKQGLPVAATAHPSQDPGERKFQANCSRCHNAPDQLSPRIAGTVVRHMRVRASLTAKDERDILRYLAP